MACRPSLLIVLLLFQADLLSAAVQPEIQGNPLAHGAWLFKVHCSRCHGDYAKERLAEDYRSADKLDKAIAGEGCRVSWGRSRGGILSPAEITALSRYMLVWEELGRSLELPPLPEIPKFESAKPILSQPGRTASVPGLAAPNKSENTLNPPLSTLTRKNAIARGAWLYTGNCYRCHLAYEEARLGRSMRGEKLQKMIERGKTSTQMSGFSLLAGGKLKNSDIAAIISYITLWEHYGRPLAIAPELLKPPAVNPSDLLPVGLPQFPQVAGNPALGKNLYLMNCSRCHGSDRAGYIGRTLLSPFLSLRPDLFLKSTIKVGISTSLMQPFSENEGGNLSPREIDAIVMYLLTASGHALNAAGSLTVKN